MTKTMTLEEVAQAMVAPGKGILAADESTGTIKKRFDSIKRREHRRHPPRLPRDDVPLHRGHEEPHLRRDPLRRDPPPEGQGRHAAGQGHRGRRRAARHQGRRRHQAAALLPRRGDHRGPRRPARPHQGLRRPRRQVRQVARRHRHRPGTCPPTTASTPTPRRWRATRRCAWRAGWCRSSSPRCSWTATTTSTPARRSPSGC